jgi:alkanesulfonate monooxygenase SsuD/methylene tetrahydromethanopterin reductase-like flavin-dependent oxidoreductase (luciferase family)
MEEAIDIIGRLWGGGPLTIAANISGCRCRNCGPPVQLADLPVWRSVISPSSFSECGRLDVPILTARLPAARIKERWAAYEAGLDASRHDAPTKARLLAQSALWRNVYVAESNAQAEDELSALLMQTRAHMMHVRHAYNPADFAIDPAMLNPWADPASATTTRSNMCLPPARYTGRRRGYATRLPSCAMPACSTCCARPASAT